MIYLVTILFNVFFTIYSKYQFKDEKNEAGNVRGKWHPWGALMRAFAIVIIPLVCFYFQVTPKEILLAGVISLPWWDIAINLIALKTNAFYNGSTSQYDKKLKGSKWAIYAALLIFGVLVKLNIIKISKEKTETE